MVKYSRSSTELFNTALTCMLAYKMDEADIKFELKEEFLIHMNSLGNIYFKGSGENTDLYLIQLIKRLNNYLGEISEDKDVVIKVNENIYTFNLSIEKETVKIHS